MGVVFVAAASCLLAASLLAHMYFTVVYQNLLFSALPARVVQALAVDSAGCRARRLRAEGEARALFAESFDHVTIVFTDIVGFTELVSRMAPAETMAMLARLFEAFDAVTLRHEAVKVETIGDAYIVCTGALSAPRPDDGDIPSPHGIRPTTRRRAQLASRPVGATAGRQV
jgi:class 3 adenylate cyclase